MTANTGREVVVDVDRVDAGRLQGVALQVRRLRPVSLRDPPDADQGGPDRARDRRGPHGIRPAAGRVRVCRPAASGACRPVLPCPRRARSGGWLARTVRPSAPGAGLNGNPLRTPAAAGGADAAPGRTWNGGPASIPGP